MKIVRDKIWVKPAVSHKIRAKTDDTTARILKGARPMPEKSLKIDGPPAPFRG